ncbi:kinase-like domain-containing protein [Fusarium mexicanum]|uniref:Kinase-like domain-containing protein n=1 Tax=Fusarium mexicanum TaxID=751941 RepID=A0A8H5ICF9_9HYPO|nr:kinase-like domain-containing protein [Fusarium mexicanum]
MAQGNFKKSFPIEEIDDDSWMIGQVIISRHASKPDGPSWNDGKGAFFAISEVPSPKPSTRPLSGSCPIVELSCGPITTSSGMFEVGHASLTIDFNIGTPEHVTLERLAEMDLSFKVPKVHYHGVHSDRYYLVCSSFPSGRNLLYAWTETDDHDTRSLWVSQIADACVELSKFRGSAITAIDGGILNDHLLLKEVGSAGDIDYEPEKLGEDCSEIGLDCSELAFALNNIQPLAFTVNNDGLVGISSWRHAGFVPKDWIGTKVRSNDVMASADVCNKLWTEEDLAYWSYYIGVAMKENGFREFWYDFAKWNSKKAQRHLERTGAA